MSDGEKALPLSSVAVVITGFNHGHFLSAAIDSVLAQTHRPDEIIVVDDGSTDDTNTIVTRYFEVRYLWQENGGLAAARNAGLALAQSTHILFLDADDMLRPDALANTLNCFKFESQAALVHAGYREIGSSLGVVEEIVPSDVEDAYQELLKHNYIGMHGAVLYNKGILRAAGGFDELMKACEDYDVYLRLSRFHPIASSPTIAADYRKHGDNMSNNVALMLRSVVTRLAQEYEHVRGRPDLLAAWREGMQNWRMWYGDQLLREIQAKLMTPGRRHEAFHLITVSLRYDPHLIFRRLRPHGSRLKRRLLRFKRSPATG